MSFRVSLLAFACLPILSSRLSAHPPPVPAQNREGGITLTSMNDEHENGTSNTIPFKALETFVDVFDAIKQDYVEPVGNETLIENAIHGMLARLDPHSAYMNKSEYHTFEKQRDGDYAGIGVVLDIKSGSIRVVSAISDSPAARAGIKSGDIISQVDGQTVAELNLAEIDELFAGKAGSKVTLLIQRGTEMLELELSREIIHTNSVSSRMLTPDFAYLRISQFQEDTAEALVKEIESLRVKYAITGAIIDLRDNPGGLLESAVDTVDLFLDRGIIVFVRGRNAQDQEIYRASDGDILAGKSIIVLVNAGSASAAEIFAAALQDNRRALIVGERTFGKGSVQTVSPLYHGGAIKQTTARYYTPSGASIQAIGIIPQVKLSPLRLDRAAGTPEGLAEANLSHHLENTGESAPSRQTDKAGLAETDFPLYEALNLLQAMRIVQSPKEATRRENAGKAKNALP